ncbi:MAG: hypothetical protein ACI9R3_005615 [Verrucomicrobiales bacterium]|jgi:uncharacterized protein YrrD
MHASDTNTDPLIILSEKAAAYHATLDELSDRLDQSAEDTDNRPAITRLRKRMEQLRIHIRLLRRSRRGSLVDLEAGIEISIDDIKRAVAGVQMLALEGHVETKIQRTRKNQIMLRSIKEMIGYAIDGAEENIGKVKDFLFDDERWGIRYLVADTGGWLSANKVLVSPRHIAEPETGAYAKSLQIDLTKKLLESAPPLEANAPVSRRYEAEFAEYHGHAPYWGGAEFWGAGAYPDGAAGVIPPNPEEVERHAEAVQTIEQNCHIRSAEEIIGYDIAATDGEIGHVEDFIADTHQWRLRYLVIDTRNWLPGRKVLIDIDWLNGIDWSVRKASVGLTMEQIKDAPEFRADEPVNRDYEQQLYDFYGRPYYW